MADITKRFRRLIENGWRTYAEHVVPKNAPPVQIQECRRAFYAGAAQMFDAFTHQVADLTEDQGVAAMGAISDELAAYVQDVKEGRK